jgi:hypothetical protein
MTHARFLYLEFINKVDWNSEYKLNPIAFIYGKLLSEYSFTPSGETMINYHVSNKELCFDKMKHFSELILGWHNRKITMENRSHLADCFLQPYLIFFCIHKHTSYNMISALEYIFHKYKNENEVTHAVILNELYNEMKKKDIKQMSEIHHIWISKNQDLNKIDVSSENVRKCIKQILSIF